MPNKSTDPAVKFAYPHKTPLAKVLTVGEFFEQFGTEESCLARIKELRWGADLERFVCPVCEHKQGWWLPTRKLVECRACHHQVSITAGTVFHRLRSPLCKWFGAGYRHQAIVTGSGPKAVEKFPWVHTFISNMKRMILGTHHNVSPKYLTNYLAEFAYRANRRWMEARLFDRLLVAAVSDKAVTYKQLVTRGS